MFDVTAAYVSYSTTKVLFIVELDQWIINEYLSIAKIAFQHANLRIIGLETMIKVTEKTFKSRSKKYIIKTYNDLKHVILQLDPSLLVETPLGRGLALVIIDYGMHQNTCWVVTLAESGKVKHFDCNDIILSTNYTYHLNLKRNSNHEGNNVWEISNT